MFPISFKLYLVTDRKQTAKPLLDVIREASEASGLAIQFREKDLSMREQLEMALEIRKITKQFAVPLFINDRVDLCLAIDADGVHLPATGLPITVARKMLGKQKGIGVSCHSLEDVLRAESEGADFALLGPIYDTPSKRAYGPPLEIDYFREVKQTTSIPLFAIGGIKEETLKEVIEAGANGVAMISPIMKAKNVAEQCRTILEAIDKIK